MVMSSAIADRTIGRHAHTPSRYHPSLRALFGNFTTAMEATAEYRRLSGLTDAQLSARGLTREDIARTVFEHRYDV